MYKLHMCNTYIQYTKKLMYTYVHTHNMYTDVRMHIPGDAGLGTTAKVQIT